MAEETLEDYAPPTRPDYRRDMSAGEPIKWLRAGVRDTFNKPFSSLLYGLTVFAGSLAIIYVMLELNIPHWLAPALAGFMVMGPALAVGLYEKSRRLGAGE